MYVVLQCNEKCISLIWQLNIEIYLLVIHMVDIQRDDKLLVLATLHSHRVRISHLGVRSHIKEASSKVKTPLKGGVELRRVQDVIVNSVNG